MSFFDLLEDNYYSSGAGESFNLYNDKLDEVEKRILPILTEEITVGESFSSALTMPKSKNVDDLLKELDNLKTMKLEITDNKILQRIKKLIIAISAKIESTKFLPGVDIKKFKWKKNTPYIVLHKGQTFFGTIISAVTASPFSHVDLVINGDSYTAYDTPLGVNKYKIPDTAKVVIYELNKDIFNVNKIIDFLKKRNVSTNEYLFSAVVIDKKYETIYDKDKNQKRLFKGYRLMQDIKIESNEVEKIETISREITELINMGVEFYSSKPQYYYTKLTELKKELIEHATENAKTRAETIASKSGFKLGRLKNANMGVFQIIARNSNEDYSWAGTFNTTSKQKTATITMKLQFGIQ